MIVKAVNFAEKYSKKLLLYSRSTPSMMPKHVIKKNTISELRKLAQKSQVWSNWRMCV